MKRLLVLVLVAITSNAFALEGRVVGVHDGDTITLLDSQNQQHKIRLAEIDAPELGQPWGKNAKKTLSDMVFSRNIEVTVDSVDKYGREVGTIFAQGLNVNYEQLKLGSAWAYTRYAKSNKPIELQKMAEQRRKGLWSLPTSEQIPPWEWRKRE